MISNDKYIIIFSGYNQRAIVAFLRTLEKNRIDNYIIIAKSEDDDIFQTKYREKVAVTRKEKKLDLKEIVNIIINLKVSYGFDRFLIAPSTEALNRFLIQYWSSFRVLGAIDCLVDNEVYVRISDKKKFSDICNKENISVPQEIEFPDEFYKSFVAKPFSYSSSRGDVYSPVIIKNENDYNIFVSNYPIEEFYYQEYIEGKSIYLLYYVTRDKKVFKFSQENLIQQPCGKSIVAAKAGKYHESNVSELFEKLFLKLDYFGFIMIEIRCCLDNSYMIEANPRFWGPSQLFVDAGYNFFDFFLQEYGFLETISMDKVNYSAMYYWYNGIETIQEKERLVFFNEYEKVYDSEKDLLLEKDVYRREDTMQLFWLKK